MVVPLVKLAAGVNVAVRVVPLPEMVPKEPFAKETSSLVKLLPGSSVNEKVMAAVSSALSLVLSLVIEMLGTIVSTCSVVTPLATLFRFVLSLTKASALTLMLAVPAARAGLGVKLALNTVSLTLVS